MAIQLPPCGLYRTTAQLGGVPAERLVYFHNHGDPGPGVYVPEKWNHNRAQFSPRGNVIDQATFKSSMLSPLPPEGMYRVTSGFHCCEKQCVRYEPETMVQLGYNGNGRALLFAPEYTPVLGTVTVPERGTMIDDKALGNLVRLSVREKQDTGAKLGEFPRFVMH